MFSMRGMAGGVECVSLVGVEVREDGVLLVFEGLVVCFVYRCVKGVGRVMLTVKRYVFGGCERGWWSGGSERG